MITGVLLGIGGVFTGVAVYLLLLSLTDQALNDPPSKSTKGIVALAAVILGIGLFNEATRLFLGASVAALCIVLFLHSRVGREVEGAATSKGISVAASVVISVLSLVLGGLGGLYGNGWLVKPSISADATFIPFTKSMPLQSLYVTTMEQFKLTDESEQWKAQYEQLLKDYEIPEDVRKIISNTEPSEWHKTIEPGYRARVALALAKFQWDNMSPAMGKIQKAFKLPSGFAYFFIVNDGLADANDLKAVIRLPGNAISSDVSYEGGLILPIITGNVVTLECQRLNPGSMISGVAHYEATGDEQEELIVFFDNGRVVGKIRTIDPISSGER